MLTYRSLSEVHVVFAKGASIYLLEARPQVHQFSAARYHADLEESLAVAPEEVAIIDVLAGYLDCESDWSLAALTEVQN